MISSAFLRAALKAANDATLAGPPAAPSNPFFGVGPISDGSLDEVDRRQRRLAFERWVEARYRKRDDRGQDLGGYTTTELARSMHRGEPADSILRDMMGTIHRYFGLPVQNRLAVGLGGGHTGFTVCLQHLMTLSDPMQHVYVDTPRPETPESAASGFFRQSWATQIIDLCRFSHNGTTDRLHFAPREGSIPSAETLEEMGIRLFVGVGHETTGASTYSTAEMIELLHWLDADPTHRHAVIDATSLLGAMPWPDEVVQGVLSKCCLFMPLQKAIGGVAGYYVASFTPAALRQIETNLARPSWAIPRQLSLGVPVDPARPVSGPRSVAQGPFYDPETDRMTGGVINTYSLLAFAETTFGLLGIEREIGPAAVLNARSTVNRQAVRDWVTREPLFELAVSEPEKQGTAVTLLCVKDPGFETMHEKIVARAKMLLGYPGLTAPDGRHEAGLGTALYINAFPGMPGDFRAWIGGVRETTDIIALLENLRFAWLRAKAQVIGEELAQRGEGASDETPACPQASEPTSPASDLRAFARTTEDLAAIAGGLTRKSVPEYASEIRRLLASVSDAARAAGITPQS